MAVHGDMILGTAEEVQRAGIRAVPPKQRNWIPPRNVSVTDSDALWPNGVVPYIIDSDVPDTQRILDAISEWNTRTAITLIERTVEDDYVRFRHHNSTCNSHVGRIGGEQVINLMARCGVDPAVHEIGHAVGLWHEHEREDREAYVMVLENNLDPAGRLSVLPTVHPATGPYDFSSTMHYSPYLFSRNGKPVLETIPPGMLVGSVSLSAGEGYLSAGDVDGVARLYGRVPLVTTLSTNPPGLDIVVDGRRVTTPQKFRWSVGSEHVLEAPVVQTNGSSRSLFGRWNFGGSSSRKVISFDGSNTWIEANFIVQHRIEASSQPQDVGTVRVAPESPDGFYTLRTPVQISGRPNQPQYYTFRSWSGGSWGFSRQGLSANPASFILHHSAEYRAVFSRGPQFLIRSNIDPTRVNINDWWNYTPIALEPQHYRNGLELSVPELQTGHTHGTRHRFQSWSDGGEISHRIHVPASGGEITLTALTEHKVITSVRPVDSGEV